ncbi:DUF1109 domain-containing protein [Sphingobium sp. AS12]|uniref:NrsF family protein n=1 Tax=Sphingobium sp. AS12 TaxID=2849495 RepID=UPI001C31341C|nr:DUF1109 domain-containing protein [Sphingobium sp. AS12]MBV2150110.1 DUF1109 domain-containing protein [Sphingobium sp. AS12]
MPNDLLIDELVGDLRPVRPHNPVRQVAWLAVLAALELGGFAALGTVRPDLASALDGAAFWWKVGGLASLAAIGVATALRSFDPVSSPRKNFRWWIGVAAVLLAAGWLIDLGNASPLGLAERLQWRMGLQCLFTMTLLSLPPILALAIMMRRGAPTDRSASALATGAASAAWGAFIFAFHCPSDDPFYIAVWYSLGCGLVILLSRTILPSVARW